MYTERDGEDYFILIDFDLAVEVDDDGTPKGQTSRHRTGTLPFMAYELLEDMHNETIELDEGKPSSSRLVHCVRLDYQSVSLVSLWCAIKLLPKTDGQSQAKTKTKSKPKPKAAKARGQTTAASAHQSLSGSTSEFLPQTVDKSGEDSRYERYLQSWETGTYKSMANGKQHIIEHPEASCGLPLSPFFEHLLGWFYAFFAPFQDGISRKAGFEKKLTMPPKKSKSLGKTGVSASSSAQPSFEDYETLWGAVTCENFMKSFQEYEDDFGED